MKVCTVRELRTVLEQHKNQDAEIFFYDNDTNMICEIAPMLIHFGLFTPENDPEVEDPKTAVVISY